MTSARPGCFDGRTKREDDHDVTPGNALVRPFTARFPHEPAELAPVRRRLAAWLRAAGLDVDDQQRVLLASGEACANAVEHARPSSGSTIALSCRIEAATGAIVVRVRDAGRWGGPAPRADRGFGLRLIGHLADEVAVRAGGRGTAVELRIVPARRPAVDATDEPDGAHDGVGRACLAPAASR